MKDISTYDIVKELIHRGQYTNGLETVPTGMARKLIKLLREQAGKNVGSRA